MRKNIEFAKYAALSILGIVILIAALAGCDNLVGRGPQAPAAPGAPTVTPADRQLTVTWTAVEGATAYEVWYGTSSNSASATQFGGDVTGGTTAAITGLANGTAYYVWVKAKNGAGTSGFSAAASGTPVAAENAPSAPAAPTVTPADAHLTVTWTAVIGATAYEVWYGAASNSASAQQFGGDVTGGTTAAITGLTNGTAYYVWVKAKNGAGTSGFSAAASGTPVAAENAPSAPAAPTVQASNAQLTVTWQAVSGATAYEVWYGTANNSAGAQQFATEPTTTTATITGLGNGTTYYVWVKAKNGAGTSGFSPAASGTPSGANTKLSALALAQHNGTTNPYPLYRQKMSPDFTSATTQYTLEVNYWVDYLLIEATRSDANAVVSSTAAQGSPTVAGNKYTFRFMLNPGDNTIPITVTNGTAAQTYTITINRDTEYTASQKTASVNQIPPWTKGYWAFEFLRSVEALLIDTSPRQAGSGGFGYLEFCDMFEMGLAWIAGDIVYSQAFSPKSGVFILKLDRDNTMAYIDGGDYYAIYWFDKRGSGVRPNGVTSGGMKTRFFQSNTEALAAGANTLNDAKTTFIVDDWYFSHLTQIWGVGDPQIKRSDDPDYQFTPTGGDDWLD